MSSKLSKKELADRIQALCVLVVDDNQYMRKMIGIAPVDVELGKEALPALSR
jgi:hypothetical protein